MPKPPTLDLNRATRESADAYVTAIREACAAAKLDPIKVIEDTDAYPKIVKTTPMLEFMIGWVHGVAESHGLEPGAFWEALAATQAPAPKAKLARRPILLGQAQVIPDAKPARKRAKAA